MQISNVTLRFLRYSTSINAVYLLVFSAVRIGSTPVVPPSSDEFVQDLKHKIFALEDEVTLAQLALV